MSETAPETEQTAETAGWTPPANQQEFNKIIAERVAREKAKFADYSALQAKASKLDEIEAANQTELDKANKRAEEAEKALAAAQTERARLAVAAKHGISGEHLDLLSGSDEAELEDKAVKIAALIAAQQTAATGTQRELFLPAEGKSPAALNSDALETALKQHLGVS